jgi:hypothetical protein
VVALVGGLALLAAFFMPWFAAQGLLLSGQFLNDFLASASASDLQRFMPGTSPAEARMLRGLVDLFPACGAAAVILTLLLSYTKQATIRLPLLVLLLLCGLVPLAAWLAGISRLPAGATFEVGLWLIACAGAAILIGAAPELIVRCCRSMGPARSQA